VLAQMAFQGINLATLLMSYCLQSSIYGCCFGDTYATDKGKH